MMLRFTWLVVLIGCSSSSVPDASIDASSDAFVPDAFDGSDAGFDGGSDAGSDAGFDGGTDVGPDAFDAGPPDLDGDGVTADEDCDDDDPSVWMLLPGFVDMDADEYGTGEELEVCSGDALPEGWAEVDGDCDDDDTDNWLSCDTCVDEDDDDWFVGCDRYLVREGPDCDDSARRLYREVEVFPDVDGDGRGTGVGTLRCIGSRSVGLFEAIGGGDCDEGNDLRRAGMPELPDDGIDNDCDGLDRSALDDDGIYVANAHTDCQDLTPGTRAMPNCTLGAALGFSVEGDAIYLAEGTYDDPIDTRSRSFFGGYDSSDWTPGTTTTILDSGMPVQLRGTVGMSRLTIRDRIEAIELFVYECELESVFAFFPRAHLVVADSQASAGVFFTVTASGLVTRSSISNAGGDAIDFGSASPVYVRDSTASGRNGCYTPSWARVVIERSACIGTEQTGATFFGVDAEALISNSYLRGGSGTHSWGLLDNGNTTVINSTIDAGDGTTRRVGLATTSVGERTIAINNVIVVRGSATVRTAGIEVRVLTDDGRFFNNLIHAPMGDVAHYELAGDGPISLAELNACAWTGCTAASGNISVDPMLAPDGIHLMSGSPAIDQGVDPATISGGFAVTTDYDGDARPARSGWDIGADEVP